MVDTRSLSPYGHIKLALFVDGGLLSTFVLKQVDDLKEEFDIQDDQLTTYNVRDDIEVAMEYNIIACPTLVRLDVRPPRFLIGELRNRAMVLAFLNINAADGKQG